MTDALRPGEMTLEDEGVTATPDPDPVDPPADPLATATDEPETPEPSDIDPPVAAAPAEPAPKKHHGAVAELIEKRREAKENKERAEALERELGDYRRAIAEGKLLAAPPPSQQHAEQRQQKIAAIGKRLGLVKADGGIDTDAAERAYDAIQEVAQETLAPLQHTVAAQQAQAVIDYGMKFGREKLQYQPEALAIIEQTMREAGPQITNPEIAKVVWERGVGRAAIAGKLSAAQAAQAGGTAAPSGTPPPIPSEPTGRRPQAAQVALPPKLAALYKEHNMDPAKGWTKPAADFNPAAMALED